MNNDDEKVDESKEQPTPPTLFRTLLTPECYPRPHLDGAAWVQQQTVLSHLLIEQLSNLYTILSWEAPMVLERSAVGIILAAIGNTHQQVERLGFEWMAAHGVTPLDLHAEAVRVARAQIEADPDMPEEVKADLTALIESGELDETAESAPDEEAVDELLFVKGDSEQVH